MPRSVWSLRIKRPDGKYVTWFHFRKFNRAGRIVQCVARISQQYKVLASFPGGRTVIQDRKSDIESVRALEFRVVDRSLMNDVT